MKQIRIYKKIYLHKIISIAIYFSTILLVYSIITAYLEVAAIYAKTLDSSQEQQSLSLNVRILKEGIRIFLLILFIVIGIYSHTYKIQQSYFLSCFGYSKFIIFRINACVTLFEVLLPDLVVLCVHNTIQRWILQYFQKRYSFPVTISADLLLHLQLFLLFYFMISLLNLSLRHFNICHCRGI